MGTRAWVELVVVAGLAFACPFAVDGCSASDPSPAPSDAAVPDASVTEVSADGTPRDGDSVDGSDASLDASADADVAIEAGKDGSITIRDAESADGWLIDAGEAGSSISCTRTRRHTAKPGCEACLLPPEETAAITNVGISFGPVGSHCTSSDGPGVRSIGLPALQPLLDLLDPALDARYQLAGAAPSESYRSEPSLGCGPIPNGTFTGVITVMSKLVDVSLAYRREPAVAGCAVANGCVEDAVDCSGTYALP